jgi:uncharacterized protein YjgD (DUF1641 family)
MADPTGNGTQLAALTHEVQALAAQVRTLAEQTAYLTERAREQSVRQREWDELKADLTPVANDMYAATVEQLAEVEPHVRLEDGLRLLKRLARNTRNLELMLDQLESLQDFLADVMPLSHQMVGSATAQLDALERKGYFAFAREGMGIADRVVGSFTPDDVRQLGENIVLILSTVKAMTQPEVMNLVNNLTVTFQRVEHDPKALSTSPLSLLAQMRDPEVRRGLALTMQMLRAMARPVDAAAVTGQAPDQS